MARLRREHHRMLGNGYCTRPPELYCVFESICEGHAFFQTASSSDPPSKPKTTPPPTKDKTHRAQLFDQPLGNLNDSEAS